MPGVINDEMREFLRREKFIFIATTNPNSDANVAPKILLKIEGDDIYMADYVLNKTFKNLKRHARVSLGIVDPSTLYGYQFNGNTQVLTVGADYKQLLNELQEKATDLTIESVIRSVRTGKKYVKEFAFSDQAAIFKIHVDEVVKITPSGYLERRKENGG